MPLLDATDWLAVIVFLFIQFIGSRAQFKRGYYERASRFIPFSPRNWVFPVVWPILKLLRFFALFLFWRNADSSSGFYEWAIVLYVVNLMLDLQWVELFIGFHSATAAFVVVCGIVATGVATVSLFFIHYWLSGALYIAYVLWTGFALYLNYVWMKKGLWDEEKLKKLERKREQRKKEKKGSRP